MHMISEFNIRLYVYYKRSLLRNKRFALNEMFQQKASKSIFYVHISMFLFHFVQLYMNALIYVDTSREFIRDK